MRLEDYAEFGGIEIANANRTSDYISNGLITGVTFQPSACECAITDDGPYVSPAADPAPWYDSTRPESGEFVGLMATGIILDPIITRSVSPKLSNGATIGRIYYRHRIVSVGGYLLASTAQGMSYGERWLNSVLAGTIVGCAPDELRLLLSCPSGSGSSQFRTLRKVGIVEAPTFAQVQELAECYIQAVQFQFAAGVPWLLGDEVACLSGGYT